MPYKTYLAKLSAELKHGNATEHTHRPALKDLIESLAPDLLATNEPKRIACGAPDYIVTRKGTPIGYVEAKDVNIPLDKIEDDAQLKRYRASLRTLILTDYLEFRLYRDGQPVQTARLAKWQKNGALKSDPDGVANVNTLLTWFLQSDAPTIGNPRELAQRMAHMARMIRELIAQAFLQEGEQGELHGQLDAFRKVLLGEELSTAQFADMYAQTICYGLFAARCNHMGEGFNRENAAKDLPKTNPFLRKLFQHIAGHDLDDRIAWAVDDLAYLLARADMAAILEDFGKVTKREDPIVHFYETFLAAYDPKLRESRGVYYTPEPVVSYIVRSVDAILKRDFKLPQGLADSSKISVKRKLPNGKIDNVETHRVQILDPATGTGTFLYSVIQTIRESFAGNAGMWPGYVAEHLLPRIYGFELLMAPYAVAHMKLGLLLKDSGYDFVADERLRVYLTNTLGDALEATGQAVFVNWLKLEADYANQAKTNAPIMVIVGNPPYSGHSANKGKWISALMRGLDTTSIEKGGKPTADYFKVDGTPLGERNPKWLNDDYVKFIRFAQWRIEQTGYGVLAFITNHGYLDNPTFRGMRQSLLQAFDDIYLLDLHGNSKKKEKAPDGGKDENVFDIQQGVAISLFVKRARSRHSERSEESAAQAQIRHAEIYGLRSGKYQWLWENDVSTTKWQRIEARAPNYLLIPQDETLAKEYGAGWKITEVFPVNSVGIVTARDSLSIHWTREDAWRTVRDFAALPVEDAREKYNLGKDSQDWKVNLAQQDLKNSGPDETRLQKILYRPFDTRYTYYTGKPSGFHCRPRGEVMKQMIHGENLALITSRLTKGETYRHTQVSRKIVEVICMSPNTSNNGFVFPLYLYPSEKKDLAEQGAHSGSPGGRRPNLASEFINSLAAKLKLKFVEDGHGDLKKTFGPEDIFHYAYAVFYSPTYRSRYAQFLKIDFPRLPLTSDATLFATLCELGRRLVMLHLMEAHAANICAYPIAGNNRVDKVAFEIPSPAQTSAAGKEIGRVYINTEQYFDGVPQAVWDYHIGGYQVANKWLKDRKGRLLTFDDLQHYQRVLAALAETIALQAQIDAAIPEWPIE